MIEVYKLHVPLPFLFGHVDRLLASQAQRFRRIYISSADLLDIAQHGILDGGTLTQFIILPFQLSAIIKYDNN
jgi:hypothetical protein